MDPSAFKLQPIRLINMSVFLYYGQGRAMLVDAGPRRSEKQILAVMNKLGLEPSSLDLLVLTHTHYDHAGAAAALKAATGCRILVHRAEAERLKAGRTPFPRGTRWKARVLVTLGRIFATGLLKFPPVLPDLLSDASFDLGALGFPARVIHTPGHSPGSQVVLTAGKELLAGDSLFGLEGKKHFPPFAEDAKTLARSWQVIRELDATRLYPAHGRSFTRDSFLDEYQAAVESYGA